MPISFSGVIQGQIVMEPQLEENLQRACKRLIEIVDVWGDDEEAEPTKDLVSRISHLFLEPNAALQAVIEEEGTLDRLHKQKRSLERDTQQLKQEVD
jgi:hypothetical protein